MKIPCNKDCKGHIECVVDSVETFSIKWKKRNLLRGEITSRCEQYIEYYCDYCGNQMNEDEVVEIAKSTALKMAVGPKQ